MEEEIVPRHVAIIVDGNRRWAAARGMVKALGHREGAKTLERIAKRAISCGVPFLTVYALSTENKKNRSAEELSHLYDLLAELAERIADIKEDVRVRVIGDVAGLPPKVQEAIRTVVVATAGRSRLTLTLAINYGGRDEIVRAVHRIVAQSSNLDETTFSSVLDTSGLPDVDLLIRTGGHHRLSNFLPWQSTYAELYFVDTLWPAFSDEEFDTALAWFGEQTRNKGK